MVKIIEVYRIAQIWIRNHRTKETPAMKLGLAKGKIYAEGLFS